MQKVKILGVAGSPRKNGNTAKLVAKALEAATGVPDIETELYELAGKKIHHCVSCYKCFEKGRCAIKDDLEAFVTKYMEADGVIWGAPVFHMSVPASMKSLLDRLGNMLLMRYARQGQDMPRFNKVCGVLTGGAHRNGGQDLVLSFLIGSCLFMNGIVVSGNSLMGSYMGAAAWTGGAEPFSKDNVLNDAEGLCAAESVGKRVAEMARIVKAGVSALKENLPDEYFYTWEEEK